MRPRSVRLTPWSFLSVSWMSGLMRQGSKTELYPESLPRLPAKDQVARHTSWIEDVVAPPHSDSSSSSSSQLKAYLWKEYRWQCIA
ncbi:UNVERIFIED_CONTAM: hypothetical protein HDU68_004509, partial [Siphonaria sp. JEL0065]